MNFNNTTKTIANWLIGIWAIYIFFKRGLIGLLLSGGIALITAAFVDRIEMVAGVTIIGGYILLYLMSYYRLWEPFMDTPKEIADRLAKASHAPKFIVQGPSSEAAREAVRMEMGQARAPITGVYEEGAIEGFTVSQGGEESQGAPSESKPAVAKKNDISETFSNEIGKTVEHLVNNSSKTSQETTTSSQAQPSASPAPGNKTDPFRSDPSGLFKLGEIPTESRDGPIIDAGATFMKALQALDTSQIKSMTDDTAKMVDAQKNLIGLLNTMKPILQDGQKLLSTFTSVLGQPGGVTGAALRQ